MTKLDESMTPLWMIGCGNMGGAMLARWIAAGLDPAAVTVVRPSGRPVAQGVRVVSVIPAGEAPPRTLVLAVKPQKLADVAADVAAALGPDSLVVSILAGARVAGLRACFPAAGAIVRAVPNTPVAIGKGVVGLHAEPDTGARARDAAVALMAPLGLVEWIADEDQCDLFTALAGSGPAFLFRFVDAFAAVGAELGLPADQAARFAIATVEGAALLAAGSDETPGQLADRVASPGGSTRKGLDVLDAADGLLPLLRETLAAATRRNAEMAAEAVRA